MWYILQLTMIIFIVCLYLGDKELSKNATLGQVVLFAVLLTYALTWLIAKLIDLLRCLRRSRYLGR